MEPEKRRALTLPARLNKRTSVKRDAPSIWELQDALQNGMYRDNQDDLASDTASVSEASVRDDLSVDGSGSWQLPAGVGAYAAAAGDRAGGSWPRIRKQRTPSGAMSIWEVNEALQQQQALAANADTRTTQEVQSDLTFVDAILGNEAPAPAASLGLEPPLGTVMEGGPSMAGQPLHPEVTRMDSARLLELGADLKRTSLGSEEHLGGDMAALPPLRAVNAGMQPMPPQQQLQQHQLQQHQLQQQQLQQQQQQLQLGSGSAELDALAQLDALAAEEALEQSGKEAMVDPSELLAILESPGEASGWMAGIPSPGTGGNHFGGPSPAYMCGNVSVHDNAGPPLQMQMGPASPGFSAALPGGGNANSGFDSLSGGLSGGGIDMHEACAMAGIMPPMGAAGASAPHPVGGNYGLPAPYPAPMPHAAPMIAQSDPFERALGGRHSTRNGPERKEWTPVEDSIIREGVLQHGCRWRKIAMMLPGRSDDAVRNRWNRLRESSGDEFIDVPVPAPRRRAAPKAAQGGFAPGGEAADPSQQGHVRTPSGGGGRAERVSWTRAEDAVIVNSVQELGHKWFQIAQRLPGRTDHAIRNRYHRLQAMVEDAQLMRQQQDFTAADEFSPEVAPVAAGQQPTCSSEMEQDPSSSPPMQLAW